jgi:hypothetical protein
MRLRHRSRHYTNENLIDRLKRRMALELGQIIIKFTCGVEPGQIFHLELKGVALLLVGVRSEEGSISEFVAVPKYAGRPNPRVTEQQRHDLRYHLVFVEGLIGYTFARVNLFWVGYLQKRADEVCQSGRHFRLVLVEFVGPETHVPG